MFTTGGQSFSEDPEGWADNVRRDLETLFQRANQGSNDGNQNAYKVTQETRKEAQQLFPPLSINFVGGTCTLSAQDFNGLTGLDIRWRVVQVCVDGVAMNMLILASQPIPA